MRGSSRSQPTICAGIRRAALHGRRRRGSGGHDARQRLPLFSLEGRPHRRVAARWLKGLEAPLADIADAPDPADDKLERLILAWAQAQRDLLAEDPHLFDVYAAAAAKRPRHRPQAPGAVAPLDRAGARRGHRDRHSSSRATGKGRLPSSSDATYRFINPVAVRLDADMPPTFSRQVSPPRSAPSCACSRPASSDSQERVTIYAICNRNFSLRMSWRRKAFPFHQRLEILEYCCIGSAPPKCKALKALRFNLFSACGHPISESKSATSSREVSIALPHSRIPYGPSQDRAHRRRPDRRHARPPRRPEGTRRRRPLRHRRRHSAGQGPRHRRVRAGRRLRRQVQGRAATTPTSPAPTW